MNKTREAILKTLIYGDIFDYPLTVEEIKRFLIKTSNRHSGLSRIPNRFWMRSLTLAYQNDERIEEKNGYYFLRGREQIVALRKKREKWSREKLKMAEKAAKWLKFIPWMKMVGITGSLAMKNSDQNDDIDLLIISSKKRIWLTRFLATILMELIGKRRKPFHHCHSRESLACRQAGGNPGRSREIWIPDRVGDDKHSIKDKICLNMYLDEAHLQVPKKEQDLFTAHEVVQVKLLWDKDKIYNKFLTKNLWVKNFLPNAITRKNSPQPSLAKRGRSLPSPFRRGQGEVILNAVEKLAKVSQLWYMRSRRTTEVISDGIIRFHPQDARKWVLTKYKQRLNRLGVIV